jgi:hypothetical protein
MAVAVKPVLKEREDDSELVTTSQTERYSTKNALKSQES